MDTWRQSSRIPEHRAVELSLAMSGPQGIGGLPSVALDGSDLDEFERLQGELISAFRDHHASHPLDQLRARREPCLCAEEVASALGIQQREVVDELIDHGVSREAVVALLMVPMLTVAWADRKLSRRERMQVLGAALSIGHHMASPALAPLARWLERRPTRALREAWIAYVELLCRRLPAEAAEALRSTLLAWTSDLVRGRRSRLGRFSGKLRRAGRSLRRLEKRLMRVGQSGT